MNGIISSLTAQTYRHIAKPVLFRLPPDNVHQNLVKTATFIQNLPPARGLMRAVWAHEQPDRLSQTVAGLNFVNPIGLSAGFDKNFELVPMMKAVGFGFMEGGSLTFDACRGNPRPWYHRLPHSQALVVNAGLANQGVVKIVKRLQQYPDHIFQDFPLNISIAKTNSPQAVTDSAAVADYIGSLKHLTAARLGQMYTLNISCPNTYGGQPFTTPGRLEQLLSATDELKLTTPLFIKMPSHLDWPEFEDLAEIASRHQVAGLTIANLAYRDQVKLADPLPDEIKGKLGGKPTWERSNSLIKQTRLRFGDRFVIIGVGGVFSADDAYTKIRLGANLVELITGLIFEGPQLIGQINRGVDQLLKRDGFANVAQATGADLT